MSQSEIEELLKKENNELNADEISEKLNINLRSVQNNLKKMLEFNTITITKQNKFKKRWFRLK